MRSLCTKFPDEYSREHDGRAEFPQDFYEAVAKAGYLGVAIPEQYGGSGLGITEAALVMREIAASGGAMAAASSVHLSIFGVSPLVFQDTSVTMTSSDIFVSVVLQRLLQSRKKWTSIL